MKARLFDMDPVEVEPDYHVRRGLTFTIHDPPFAMVKECWDILQREGPKEIWVTSPLATGVFRPRECEMKKLVLAYVRQFL